jgi:CheY-like chemotaxis protein
MQTERLNLLLADDDPDDCLFFKEALAELSVTTSLAIVNDGVELMQRLANDSHTFPDMLYLDLNMPRKNGYECLMDIKSNEKLKHLPIIIWSTSFDKKIADRLYEDGVHCCIRKPAEFQNLKMVILKSIELISNLKNERPSKEEFIISSN